MTASERTDFDGELLWTDSGQVLWILEQHGDHDDLMTASKIAGELQVQHAIALNALHELRQRGQASSRKANNRELWGIAKQLNRMAAIEQAARADQAARRTQILRHNEALDEIQSQFREVFAGRAIEVSGVDRLFRRSSPEPRQDQLLIHIGHPDDAKWFLDRVRRPTHDEGMT